MALPSAFRERLEHMDQTRNKRLSTLQAEKEIQTSKSQLLASKIANVRSMELRCLKLDQKIASQHFIISSLKSEIDQLDSKYHTTLQQFRVLKSEVEDLEEMEKAKDRYFALKVHEMEEFKAQVENFAVECQVQVEELRNQVNELKSRFMELQGNNGFLNNSELAEAEMRKSELLAAKEKLNKSLASNYRIRAQLQKQLQSILITQNQDVTKLCYLSQRKYLEKAQT